MSRIGLLPIRLPDGVDATIDGRAVSVKGPKGTLSLEIPYGASISQEGAELRVAVKDPAQQSALWGLSRALVANLVTGVSEGFEKKLEISGVGYRAAVQGKKLVMGLGFSHPVEYVIPDGIEVAVEDMVITVRGIDRQLVGQAAANIRALRPVEPYKGKGILYVGEHVRRKVGKRVVASEG